MPTDREMQKALEDDGEKLRQLTGEDHGPFCPACLGSGVEVFAITVYEPGCGYSHDSTDERPCRECDGSGHVEPRPDCNCRYFGECDGSCTHPAPPDDDIAF